LKQRHIGNSSVDGNKQASEEKGRSIECITTAALCLCIKKKNTVVHIKKEKERENKRREKASNVKALASVVAQHTYTHVFFFYIETSASLNSFISTSVALFFTRQSQVSIDFLFL
jgi:hypothetical protein